MSTTEQRKNRWKCDFAKEIETKPGCTKIGFVDSAGEYHVFHDMNIIRALSRKDESEDALDILEFETASYVVQMTGFKLDCVNAAYHDSELYRVAPSPDASHKDHRERVRAFVATIAVFSPIPSEDVEEERDY